MKGLCRKIFAVILLLAVGACTFQKAIALLDYRLNRAYIAATLCVNRDNPRSCCAGKCYRDKQLSKEEKSPQGSSIPSKEKNTLLIFCKESHLQQQLCRHPLTHHARYYYGTEPVFPAPYFHPPCFC